MSKHAVEAFTDALAAEMAKFGVEVSVVEPGNYRSSISASVRARTEEQGGLDSASLFAEEMAARFQGSADRAEYPEPVDVAEAALAFLNADEPKRRYMVVPNQGEAEMTIRKALEELVQLNHDHAFSYDRDELVRMLDEALAGLGPR
jgi:NAD(P)-dependent dehydrogenase (short-subunit alcohol dehydrogenase family)